MIPIKVQTDNRLIYSRTGEKFFEPPTEADRPQAKSIGTGDS